MERQLSLIYQAKTINLQVAYVKHLPPHCPLYANIGWWQGYRFPFSNSAATSIISTFSGPDCSIYQSLNKYLFKPWYIHAQIRSNAHTQIYAYISINSYTRTHTHISFTYNYFLGDVNSCFALFSMYGDRHCSRPALPAPLVSTSFCQVPHPLAKPALSPHTFGNLDSRLATGGRGGPRYPHGPDPGALLLTAFTP